MNGRQRTLKGILTLALAVLMLTSLLALPAGAAEASPEAGSIEESPETGITVEKMTFCDVLQLYLLEKSAFGTNAAGKDAEGITNAARALAAMYTYTVGLNYTGEGMNYNYFSKDITGSMGQEPYTEENLKGAYPVEIAPFHGYAVALPEGRTTTFLVYCAGHEDTAGTVENVYHYVWKEGERYYAVKDDGTYYKVSYNGDSAVTAAGKGAYLFRAQIPQADTGNETGTVTRTAGMEVAGEAAATAAETATREEIGTVGEWTPLFDASADTAVQLADGTLLAGDSTAVLFGVTAEETVLNGQTGLSRDLKAVSNYVQGSAFCTNGPLLHTMEIFDAETMEAVEASLPLEPGTKYLFRLVFDEGLAIPQNAERSETSILALAGRADETDGVTDYVWYGANEYLANEKYDPERIEFCYTPSENAYGVVLFRLNDLVGDASRMSAATVFARLPEEPAQETKPETTAETPEVTAAVAETTADTASASQKDNAPSETAESTAAVSGRTPLSRGEAAVLLWKYCGSPEPKQTQTFLDMPEDADGSKAISWAAGQGYIQGYGDGYFGTYDAVSREQSAVIICRVAMKTGRRAAATCTIVFYKDVSEVSSWAREAVSWAVQNGYYTVENDCLYPRNAMLRDEFETILSAMGNTSAGPNN